LLSGKSKQRIHPSLIDGKSFSKVMTDRDFTRNPDDAGGGKAGRSVREAEAGPDGSIRENLDLLLSRLSRAALWSHVRLLQH
jgi:hypothetical protein